MYDNHEQVWQQEIDEAENPNPRIGRKWQRVELPSVGDHVFMLLETRADAVPRPVYALSLGRMASGAAAAAKIYLPGADSNAGSAAADYFGRRARWFSVWMGVKRETWDPDAGPDDWVFMSNFNIHNEGVAVPLVGKDGTPTGYSVKLERLTYQNTNTPVLKLGIIEDATGKTSMYTWTQPGSAKIGINLRWFQVGLTAAE